MLEDPVPSEFAEAPQPALLLDRPLSGADGAAFPRRKGPAALGDEALLALVLGRGMPRGEASELARRLMARFGDFNGAVSASPVRLAEVAGMGSAAIEALKLVEAAAHRLAQARVLGRSAITSWCQLVGYCRTVLAHRATESFRVLFLDRGNCLIADEEQGRGTVDHVPVYPREVVKRALELDASAIIMVHNHPSGDPNPSEPDIAMTRRVAEACLVMGITLHDHVIVGAAHETSFRQRGLIS